MKDTLLRRVGPSLNLAFEKIHCHVSVKFIQTIPDSSSVVTEV